LGFLTRIGSALGLSRHTEGQPRPGPWYLPITGGWLPQDVGQYWNWWQLGYDPTPGNATAIVEACVSAYAQTVAMCPGDHWRAKPNGGRERVTNSALTRILRRPNDYQTISDFLLNATRSLYLNGNAYAFAVRNDRSEVVSLHLMNPRSVIPAVAETGEVFYRLAGNRVVDEQFDNLIIPSRDVLHIRLHTDPDDPLKGKTPLEAAALDNLAIGAMTQQQVSFYLNRARPGLILSTEAVLSKEQAQQAREAWDAVSAGLNAGGTAIATGGLKPYANPTMSAKDAELAEMMKLSTQNIALVFRVPLQILGIGGTPFASTELLMQSWIASGLGFALNHIEEAFGQLFGLKGQPDEYLELNTAALLRSAHKDRIEAFARGVQGGIYSPNEARAEFELPAAKDGDEPRVQQQVVPLSFGAKQQPAPAAPPPAAPEPDEPEEDEPDAADPRAWASSLLSAADDYDRRAA
jgi:HK97 family phage portal protein